MELYLVMVALMLVAFLITYLTSRILSSKVLAMIRGNGDDRRRGHRGYSPNYREKTVTFPGGLVFVAGCAIVVTVAVFGGFERDTRISGIFDIVVRLCLRRTCGRHVLRRQFGI